MAGFDTGPFTVSLLGGKATFNAGTFQISLDRFASVVFATNFAGSWTQDI
jgi:hypothetical protein